MPTLRENYTLTEHVHNIETHGFREVRRFVLVSTTVFTFLWVLLRYIGFNVVGNAVPTIVQSLNALPTNADRQAAARSILNLHYQGFGTDLDNLDDNYQQTLIKLVQGAAHNGHSITYKTTSYDNASFISWFISHMLATGIVVTCVLLVMMFASYANASINEGKYLVDMPWRRGWPVAFVLLTAVPGLPFYLMSAVNFLLDKRHPERYAKQGKQNDNTEEARNRYITLREIAWKMSVTDKITHLPKKIRHNREEIIAQGERLDRLQERRSSLLAEQRKLAAIDLDSLPVPDPEHLNAEFDKLLALPGVAAVGTTAKGEIWIRVEARLEHNGKLYDMGDWEVRFGRHTKINTRQLRSGTQPGWPSGRYPDYRLPGGRFCFGNRKSTIDDNLAKGQLLEAVELTVNSMQSVNEKDLYKIPDALKEIKQ